MANQMNKDKSEEDHCQIYFSSLPVCQTSATHKSTTIIYIKKKSNVVKLLSSSGLSLGQSPLKAQNLNALFCDIKSP